MKRFLLILAVAIPGLLASCKQDVQIAENTFIHENKVYKLIDNELREIEDFSSGNIKKFEVSKPRQRDFGMSTLSFVKRGASTSLKALYRGNFLYYSLRIDSLNDLRESYLPGTLTIEFIDEYGFIMHSTPISTSDLTGMVGSDGRIEHFIYNGKTEMSTEINNAIKKYSISASLKQRALF